MDEQTNLAIRRKYEALACRLGYKPGLATVGVNGRGYIVRLLAGGFEQWEPVGQNIDITNQLRIEGDAADTARERFERGIEEATAKGAGAMAAPMRPLVYRWGAQLIGAISKNATRLHRQCPRASVPSPDVLAMVTIETAVNLLAKDIDGVPRTKVFSRIGWRLEREAAAYVLRESNVGDANPIAVSLCAVTTASRLCGFAPWTPEQRNKLAGDLLCLLVANATVDANGGEVMAFKDRLVKRRGRQVRYVEMTGDAFDVFLQNVAEPDLLPPKFLPMLIPPLPLSGRGPYLQTSVDVVRGANRLHADFNYPPAYAEAIDFAGDVPWKLNLMVYAVASEAMRRGDDIYTTNAITTNGQTKRRYVYALKAKPPRELTEKQHRVVRSVPVRVRLAIAKGRGASVLKNVDRADAKSLRRITSAVEKQDVFRRWLFGHVKPQSIYRRDLRCIEQTGEHIAPHQRVYFPLSPDYRGRIYPLPDTVSYHGHDLQRAFLTFANPTPVNDRAVFWLKVHCAAMFGHDETGKTFAERVAWADRNMEMIFACARRHGGGWMPWMAADKPWRALAACVELADILEPTGPKRKDTRLPIELDCTCSGLQHYSAMARDEQAAPLVNLIGSDRGDAYASVAAEVRQLLANVTDTGEQRYAAAILDAVDIDRSMVKKAVMTRPYGLTPGGMRKDLLPKLRARVADDDVMGCVSVLARCVEAGIGSVMPRAMAALRLLQSWAAAVAATGRPIVFCAPSGFEVRQTLDKYYKPKTKPIRLIDKTKANIALPVDGRRATNQSKQRNAFAPNFIHALDSTHLVQTVSRCARDGVPVGTVHDCYLVHATNADRLRDICRDEFAEIHRADLLADLHRQLSERYKIEDLALPHVRGSLDILSVRSADYFLC